MLSDLHDVVGYLKISGVFIFGDVLLYLYNCINMQADLCVLLVIYVFIYL